MTLRMHMTQVPVGACPDCHLDSGHINGCTVPLMAQKAAQKANIAASVDSALPAKQGRVRLYSLAEDLLHLVSTMDLREILASQFGVVTRSTHSTIDVGLAAEVREFVLTHHAAA